jgi:hypothetical protein
VDAGVVDQDLDRAFFEQVGERRAGGSRSVTSKETASALPPLATISATSTAAFSPLRLACTMTWQPSAASRRQIAAPMPPLPPVTSARFMTGCA